MMKKLLGLITVLVVSFGSFAQSGAKIEFKEETINYGEVVKGEDDGIRVFEFTNTGDAPLIIENATASCGCTTPTWPPTPIMKGKSEKVKAGFNAASPGVFEKGIFVKVKGYDYPVEIKITGEVVN